MATKGHDEGRVEDLELALEIGRAGGDLVGLRIAIVRGPALDDVRDEDLVPSPAERGEELDEQVAGPPDERTALAVLVLARSLPDEDDLRVGVALTWHGPRPCLVEPAAGAGSNVGGHLLERRQALVVGHAEPSALAPTGSRTRSSRGRSPPYGWAPRTAAAWTHPRRMSSSAIWTVFVAAPLRRLSLTTQNAIPRPPAIDGS